MDQMGLAMRRFPFQALLALLVSASPSVAQARELVLNFEDPSSMALILAVVPKAETLPHWIRETEAPHPGNFALAKKISPGIVENSTLYLYSVQSLDSGLSKKLLGMPRLELDTYGGQTVEIQPTSDSLGKLPVCDAGLEDQQRCRVSDLSNQVLAAAMRHAKDNGKGFAELLAEKKLMVDDRSTKRVLVTLNDQQEFQHADFVGLVRGEDEKLSAPDSASVFVVRLGNDGVFSIVERRQDADFDLDAMKFSFEEKK
ncbi:hypothetical protein [Rhizobium phaseoli]|uniref:hypothetical protein n=1 Tax=Rhizobium phaseoli TaxID=396 RepID=UPI000BEA0140|nr:hypothetical protein [Rhizobium phaseoli]PDS69632.1 hypothetical protein CO651_22950 [Rhizobium phaseoli]